MAEKVMRNVPRRDLDRGARMTGATWGFLTLLAVLFLLFLPVWPYSAAWGYYPSTGLGFVFALFLFFILMGAFVAADTSSEVRR